MIKPTEADLECHARALAALGQVSRLRIVKLLLAEGSEGLPAGEIAKRLDLSQNGSSTHLSVLARAGLLNKTQAGRLVIYSARRDVLAALASDIAS